MLPIFQASSIATPLSAASPSAVAQSAASRNVQARRDYLIWGLASALGLATGCVASSPTRGVAPGAVAGRRIEFEFYGPDDTSASSTTTRGRMTVVAFGTTYNLATQGLAEQLNDLIRTLVPRINAVMVILEPPKHMVFAQAFAESLNLNFPVVMSDQATLSGGGPFGRIEAVPAAFVLDRRGRLVWQAQGPFSFSEIERNLAEDSP